MDIREPTKLELNEIITLSPQAILDGTLGEIKPTNEKVKQLIEPLLEKGSTYIIATENNTLMGWILIGTSKDQFTDKKYGFIYELYVLEEFRGNGISAKLMNKGIDQLKKEGHSEVRLSSYPDLKCKRE